MKFNSPPPNSREFTNFLNNASSDLRFFARGPTTFQPPCTSLPPTLRCRPFTRIRTPVSGNIHSPSKEPFTFFCTTAALQAASFPLFLPPTPIMLAGLSNEKPFFLFSVSQPLPFICDLLFLGLSALVLFRLASLISPYIRLLRFFFSNPFFLGLPPRSAARRSPLSNFVHIRLRSPFLLPNRLPLPFQIKVQALTGIPQQPQLPRRHSCSHPIRPDVFPFFFCFSP